MSKKFSQRFPAVAALLAGAGLASPGPAPAPIKEDDEADGPQGVSQTDLQAAFEKDADTQVKAAVSAEKDRWNAVLTDPVGKANIAGARTMLKNTDMDADAILGSLKEQAGDTPAPEAPKGNSRIDERRADLEDNGDPKTGAGGDDGDGTGGDGKGTLASIREARAARGKKEAEAGKSRGAVLANHPRG